jgi:DNA-binding CsgD family transcriptional regulator
MMCSLAQLGWGKEEASFRQFFTTQFIPGGTPEQHQWFNEMERLSTSPENAARFMREFNTIDVTSLLPKVQCPTLVLHSIRDARVPFEEGRLLAMSIPNAKFVPIDSPNHLLLGHEPGWQVWRDEIHNFLPGDDAGLDPAFEVLSERQLEILRLLAKARDNAQIAATLSLSEKTVRNQVSLIFEKLGVENRSQAIVRARDAGLT